MTFFRKLTLISCQDAPIRDDEEDDDERIVAFKKRKLDETSSVKVEPTGDEAKPVFKPMAKKNFRKKQKIYVRLCLIMERS